MAVSFNFEKPGTLPKPAVIGRSVRLLLGIGCLCFTWVVLIEGRPLVALTLPTHWGWWAGILIGFLGWGRWPQLALAFTVVGTASFKLRALRKPLGSAARLVCPGVAAVRVRAPGPLVCSCKHHWNAWL